MAFFFHFDMKLRLDWNAVLIYLFLVCYCFFFFLLRCPKLYLNLTFLKGEFISCNIVLFKHFTTTSWRLFFLGYPLFNIYALAGPLIYCRKLRFDAGSKWKILHIREEVDTKRFKVYWNIAFIFNPLLIYLNFVSSRLVNLHGLVFFFNWSLLDLYESTWKTNIIFRLRVHLRI